MCLFGVFLVGCWFVVVGRSLFAIGFTFVVVVRCSVVVVAL